MGVKLESHGTVSRTPTRAKLLSMSMLRYRRELPPVALAVGQDVYLRDSVHLWKIDLVTRVRGEERCIVTPREDIANVDALLWDERPLKDVYDRMLVEYFAEEELERMGVRASFSEISS